VIGYDTIYALQDVEDDALIGVKSTARLFGRRARALIALFYGAAVILWAVAAFMVGAGVAFTIGLAAVAAILAWQDATLDPRSPDSALVRFKANHWVGLALTLALWIESVV
jgi:4-hydroxybenzoate polyprenyltransferase